MTNGVIQLTDAHRGLLKQLLDTQPARNVFLRSRTLAGIDSLGHPILGYFDNGTLVSALSLGPNLVPVALTPPALEGFVRALQTRQRSCASIVGERTDVAPLWQRLVSTWGPARLVREVQPYLVLREKLTHAVPAIRRMTTADLDSYVVASAAMFTAEVDVDPRSINPSAYRQRVLDSLQGGRSYGLIDDHGVTRFKTDVGCLAGDYCQIQGVWLHPEWRGQGTAASLLGSAIALIQEDFGAEICLYVNDFNRPALATYARLGFEQITEFSTVFF